MWRQLDHGVETLRAFHTLWLHLGFHPEGFNLVGMHVQQGQKGYPLRPEHVESLFYAHRTVGGDEWIRAGADVLRSIDRLRLPCGCASRAPPEPASRPGVVARRRDI